VREISVVILAQDAVGSIVPTIQSLATEVDVIEEFSLSTMGRAMEAVPSRRKPAGKSGCRQITQKIAGRTDRNRADSVQRISSGPSATPT
jgi:hypothetical protein